MRRSTFSVRARPKSPRTISPDVREHRITNRHLGVIESDHADVEQVGPPASLIGGLRCASPNDVLVHPGDGMDVIVEWRPLPTVGTSFLHELFHAFDDPFRTVLGLDDHLAVFLVDFDLGTWGNSEAFPYLLWKDDSALRIHRRHVSNGCWNELVRFDGTTQIGPNRSSWLTVSVETPFIAVDYCDTHMETETWIERLLIDQLTTHDERYKHDYGDVERTTDELVGACMRLDSVLTTAESEPSSIEEFLSAEEKYDSWVNDALQSLQNRELVERVGERERLGIPFEPGDYGTTAVWEPTVEGRAEARALDEAYAAEGDALLDPHDEESEEFRQEQVSIARRYGKLPNLFG